MVMITTVIITKQCKEIRRRRKISPPHGSREGAESRQGDFAIMRKKTAQGTHPTEGGAQKW
eukprot:15288876-Alexandrium_andersonii.AAC.1